MNSIEKVLARELLERILTAPPVFFENLIVTLLVRMGYGGSREEAGRAIGQSGDGVATMDINADGFFRRLSAFF